MNDLGIRTRHPIVVTNWTNEEGARFAPAMLALGRVRRGDRPRLRLCADRPRGQGGSATSWSGSAGRATSRSGRGGCTPTSSCTSSRGRSSRPRAGRSASSPTARGSGGCEFTLTGKEAHTGSTPMAMRVNAGLGDGADHRDGAGGGDGRAAGRGRRRRAGDVQPELAQRAAGEGGVHRRHPLAGPGEARPDAGADRGARRRRSARRSGSAARSRRSGISTRSPSRRSWWRGCAAAAERLGYSHRDIVSGAGHDACWTAKVAPATMVMCPCVDGL